MLNKLAGVAERYEELERLMSDPDVAADYEKIAEYNQERANLQDIYDGYIEYKDVMEQITGAREMAENEDGELKEMAQMELSELEPRRDELEEKLRLMLLPKDPRDDKNVIMEIRAGAGGDEAGIFAADLFRMYTRYAEGRKWKTSIVSSNYTGVDGYKEVVFQIEGKGAFSRLKFESGVHRVQRVPETESQGRVHTSTATVAVLAEAEDVEIDINENDLEVQAFRAGGAGGQHVQKNDTAIRLTHKPSGIVVSCQDERSKTQNLLRAMAVLRARLYDIEQQRLREEREEARRSMVGSGDRAEKIRTYNYPQNRVTDHRINLTLYSLNSIIDGDIDEVIDELATREQAEQLQAAGV